MKKVSHDTSVSDSDMVGNKIMRRKKYQEICRIFLSQVVSLLLLIVLGVAGKKQLDVGINKDCSSKLQLGVDSDLGEG